MWFESHANIKSGFYFYFYFIIIIIIIIIIIMFLDVVEQLTIDVAKKLIFYYFIRLRFF